LQSGFGKINMDWQTGFEFVDQTLPEECIREGKVKTAKKSEEKKADSGSDVKTTGFPGRCSFLGGPGSFGGYASKTLRQPH